MNVQNLIADCKDRLRMLERIQYNQKCYHAKYMFCDGHNGDEVETDQLIWATSEQNVRYEIRYADTVHSITLVEETPSIDELGIITRNKL